MSNAIVSRLGAVNNDTGTYTKDNALFLKVFSGEVLTAFDEVNVALPHVMVRGIASGKSAQFPVIGKASAGYHTPGHEILGSAIPHAERTIVIDDLLISHTFIANIDEAKNHYDVRGEYAKQLGFALANQMDKHLLQNLVLASRGSGAVTGEPGGGSVTEATAGDFNDADKLADAIFAAAAIMDTKDVPAYDRVVFLTPTAYWNLIKSTKAINRDWANTGANYNQGGELTIAGVKVIKTNHLPTANLTTSPAAGDPETRHAGDFTKTFGVVSQRSAVGVLKLLDLAMESEYQISRQGTLMVAKYAVGMGVLRPACAVELKKA